jgi:hypothetical protein
MLAAPALSLAPPWLPSGGAFRFLPREPGPQITNCIRRKRKKRPFPGSRQPPHAGISQGTTPYGNDPSTFWRNLLEANLAAQGVHTGRTAEINNTDYINQTGLSGGAPPRLRHEAIERHLVHAAILRLSRKAANGAGGNGG